MSARYEVLALRYGSLTSTRASNYYRWDIYGEPDAPIDMDYFLWVLRSGGDVVVVDTGFEEHVGARRGRSTLRSPQALLGEVGVAPESVTQVVVTHFHYDHIGNLEAFPNATFTVQRRELEFWESPVAQRLAFAQVVEANEVEFLRHADTEGRLRVVDGDAEVAEGVALRLVGGHCPGQQIVLVEGQERPVVLASDAIHFYEEMELDRPFMLFSDLAEMFAGYETLRRLEAGGAAIVAGHDPLVLERFEALSPAGAVIGARVR